MKHSEVYQKGEDNGWLTKQNFWFDPNHEHGVAIQDLNGLYPEKYFESDHVKPETIENYCRLVVEFCEKINGKAPNVIKEFGSAGGWFAEKFVSLGIRIIGVEGTEAGFTKCINRLSNQDSDKFGFHLRDLRRSVDTLKRVDIALCTEVAEHIEPPFSATLIKSLCDASDLVWFSFEEPNTNEAHVHHCNEMPAKFWINLFDFYGYGSYKLPDWVYDQCEGRGMYIFYNKSVYEGNKFLQQ